MTITDIINNSELDARFYEFEITENGGYATEFTTYHLTHVIAENLVVVSRSHTLTGNLIRDGLFFLENGKWNEIHESRRHHSVIEDLRSGSAYDEIRFCVGGERFAEKIRSIVDASGILNI